MKKISCQYAIVRFQPFIETGEFANVGIVMIAAKQGFFGFELLNTRYKRVTQFFKELDSRVFRAAVQDLKDELNHIDSILKGNNNTEFAKNIFNEIVRPRETIIRFSNPRVILVDEPKDTLTELFSFYIERNFVTKEYQEDLERSMRKLLNGAKIGDRFKEKTITSGLYQATFPFVESRNERPFKIIKPLFLAQEKTEKIINQGIQWGARILELKRQDILPQKVLFAVNGPNEDSQRGKAYKIAVERLKETKIDVVPYSDKEEILRFAKENI
jgi:hypothetical protein